MICHHGSQETYSPWSVPMQQTGSLSVYHTGQTLTAEVYIDHSQHYDSLAFLESWFMISDGYTLLMNSI